MRSKPTWLGLLLAAKGRAAVGCKGSRDAFLVAFDLLELDGDDLRGKPWEVRRGALASLLRGAGHQGIQFSEHLDGADGQPRHGAHEREAPGRLMPVCELMAAMSDSRQLGEPARGEVD